MLAQISPLVAADLEFSHVPCGIVVRGPTHDAECRFVRGLGVADVDGEFDLEEAHGFTPLDFGVDLDEGGGVGEGGAEADGCFDPGGVADAGLGLNADAVGRVLGDAGAGCLQLLARVEMVDFDVPGLPVERLVVEDDELVGAAAFGDDFAAGSVVIEGRDVPTFDLDSELVVFEDEDVLDDFADCHGGLFGDLEGLDGDGSSASTSYAGRGR